MRGSLVWKHPVHICRAVSQTRRVWLAISMLSCRSEYSLTIHLTHQLLCKSRMGDKHFLKWITTKMTLDNSLHVPKIIWVMDWEQKILDHMSSCFGWKFSKALWWPQVRSPVLQPMFYLLPPPSWSQCVGLRFLPAWYLCFKRRFYYFCYRGISLFTRQLAWPQPETAMELLTRWDQFFPL